MNKVILCGNISSDIDLRTTNNGTPVAKFSLAVNRIKDGVDFIPIVVWNQQAENTNQFCGKGSKILVEGRMQNREYEKDGFKAHITEIIADRIEYLSKGKKEPQEAKEVSNNPFDAFSTKTESEIGTQIQITPEDLPF